MYSPSRRQGKAYKLARPFIGPYHILKLHTNGADLKLIAKPAAASIRVSLNRIRMCPKEIAESSIAVQPNPQTKQIIQTLLAVWIPWVQRRGTTNKVKQAMRYSRQREQGCQEQLKAHGQDDYIIDTNIKILQVRGRC